jgi:hypothetical protein
MSTWSDGRPTTGLFPALWVDGRGLGASLGGSFSLDLDGRSHDASREAPGPEGFVLEVGARRAGTPWRSADPAGLLSARVHWTGPTAGVWVATSGFQADRTRGTLPLIGAGAWLERGRMMFGTQLVHMLAPIKERTSAFGAPATRQDHPPVDSTEVGVADGVVPPGTSEDVRLMTGAELSMRWGLQRVDLQSRGGFAVGERAKPAYWSELRVGYHVRHGLDLFVRTRRATRVPAPLEMTSETNAAAGMQLAMGPSPSLPMRLRAPAPEFRVRALGGARHRLAFRATGSLVDVSSDANGWTAVAASRVGADRWQVELALDPGVHRIAIRVDGGVWRAPAGVPTTFDDFGGEVGLIVVE